MTQPRLKIKHVGAPTVDYLYDYSSPSLSACCSRFRDNSPALSSVSTESGSHSSYDYTSTFSVKLKKKRDSITSNSTICSKECTPHLTSHFRLKSKSSNPQKRVEEVNGDISGSEQLGKQPTKVISKRYKTQICKNWEQFGKCRFGEDCSFAHGIDELQEKKHVRKKYRSQKCVQFQTTMHCPYGPRCQFQHVRLSPAHPLPFSMLLAENTSYLKQRLQILDKNQDSEESYKKLIKKKAVYQSFYQTRRLKVFQTFAQ